MNLSLVGYAPSDNPEIAMAVLVPWAYTGGTDNRSNLKIGERVMDTYFDLQKQRAEGTSVEKDKTNNEEVVDQETQTNQ